MLLLSAVVYGGEQGNSRRASLHVSVAQPTLVIATSGWSWVVLMLYDIAHICKAKPRLQLQG
jgi:hypothetical protein